MSQELKAEEINRADALGGSRQAPGAAPTPDRSAGKGQPRVMSVTGPEGQLLVMPFGIGADGTAQVGVPYFHPLCGGLEGAAIAEATRAIFALGAQVALAALAPQSPLALKLIEAGFRAGPRMVEVVRAPPDSPAEASGDYVLYSPERRMLFADVLYRTLSGSLDAPEVPVCRDGERLMLSFEERGAFDREDFVLALAGGEPGGILLLSAVEEAVEIVYIGVAPELRGRGLGGRLMQRALNRAAARGTAQIKAFVDVANAPALAVYGKAGFSEKRAVQVFVAEQKTFSKNSIR